MAGTTRARYGTHARWCGIRRGYGGFRVRGGNAGSCSGLGIVL